jgi:2-polyprenyl-3-methyl-5-hydroxy-6-metoxy-1,4-benzoquinol methylase
VSGTAHAVSAQLASAGGSDAAIHEAALSAAWPAPSLSWLDVGCGTGDLLRLIRARHAPARLVGVDLIDWLDPDLRPAVETHIGPAETVVGELDSFDRVLMVETIEHLQAPWSALERAAERVAPGGRIVISTPNLATLRHRLELLVRGRLTSFRPDNAPHLTPRFRT